MNAHFRFYCVLSTVMVAPHLPVWAGCLLAIIYALVAMLFWSEKP